MKMETTAFFKPSSTSPATALVAAVLILVTLSLSACGAREVVSETATPEATATRPAEIVIADATDIPEVVLAIPLPGEKVLETEHFAFYVDDGFRPVDLERFAEMAENIYAQVSARLGAQSPEEMILYFQPPEDESCRARGMVLFTETGPRIAIFADEQTEEAQIRGILAHELAHVIHSNGFDRPLAGDPDLTEGLATWISRDYWTAWHQTESLDEMVRGYLAAGDYVPLADADALSVHPQTVTNGPGNCLARRDLIYTQWAAFVGYLVDTYGWFTFVELMASAASQVDDQGQILPSPPDYKGLYGKTLEALEADWLGQLQSRS